MHGFMPDVTYLLRTGHMTRTPDSEEILSLTYIDKAVSNMPLIMITDWHHKAGIWDHLVAVTPVESSQFDLNDDIYIQVEAFFPTM